MLLAAPALSRPANAQAESALSSPIEAWHLRSTHGRDLNERSLQGRWLLVYLGTAACGSRCAPPLALMQSVMQGLGFFERWKVSALFLAVDPARDTVDTLAALLAPLAPRVEGLVGRSFDVNSAARGLGVATGDVCRSDAGAAAPSEQEALHARRFYIVTPDRRIAASVDEAEVQAAAVQRLRLLMANNR